MVRCAISVTEARTEQAERSDRVIMKSGIFIAVQAGWLLLAGVGSQAQLSSNGPLPAIADTGGRVIVPTQPVVGPAVSVTTVRPQRPERRALPAEVELRVNRFKTDARTYLERQEALRRQYQGASAEERAAIRTQLEALRQEWIERAKDLRKEFSDRRQELLDKMPSRKELLMDGAKSGATDSIRNQIKDQQRDNRDR
jgi:hypothetical protein